MMKKIVLCFLILTTSLIFAIDRDDVVIYSKFFGEGHYEFTDGNILFYPKPTVLLSLHNNRNLERKIKRLSPPPHRRNDPTYGDIFAPVAPTNAKTVIKEESKDPPPKEVRPPINSKVIAVYKIIDGVVWYFGEGFFSGEGFPPATITKCTFGLSNPVIEIDTVTTEGVGNRKVIWGCECSEWDLVAKLQEKYTDLQWQIIDIDIVRAHGG